MQDVIMHLFVIYYYMDHLVLARYFTTLYDMQQYLYIHRHSVEMHHTVVRIMLAWLKVGQLETVAQ
jgi:hypothetical protein